MGPAGRRYNRRRLIYSFGSFELDTRVFELRNRGEVCPVEPQVFDVLHYLASNRDRVISKDELLEKLWPGRIVSETTLTSRLKAARKAVGDDGKAQNVIRTQHGRGYRFVADVRVTDGEPASSPVVLASPSPEIDRRGRLSSTSSTFVGRDQQLGQLDAALARALGGRRQIVFVTGEAGAGKTTLVETFLAQLNGVSIARGQCVEHRGSGEPYMPLLDAFGRLCRASAPTIEVLRRAAPSWLLQLPWLLSDEDAAALAARTSSGERMPRELVQLIERLCEETPLVLLLEDLHWSDSSTLEAIELLARQTHPARLLVIGTTRYSDRSVHELHARGQCEVLELPLLAVRELDDYLRGRLPNVELTRELAVLLHERTSGNPLFVRNLVDSWIARDLVRENAMAALETDVPDSLQQLIEKHISELDADEQQMLETASVIGREYSIAFLAATLGGDDEELERRCESLARASRFIATAGTEQWGDGTFTSRFAFTHDLYVDVIYERIPEARRARIHQQAGLALERAWHGREREHAAELALHFRRARDHARAIRYLELAGEQAAQRSAYREAVMHFSAALAMRPDEATELSLRARLAPSLVATRGWADPEAEKNYLRAVELARAFGNDAALSQLLYGMANMYEYRGEYKRSEQIVLERLALDGEKSNINALESHELLACSMLHQGRYVEAVEHGARAIAMAEAETSPFDLSKIVLLVQAYGWMSDALTFTGHEEEALLENEKAIALANTSGDDLARASALAQAAFVRFYRREPDVCRRLCEEVEVIARERRLPFHLACARILLGWCRAHEGEHEEAVREVRAGIRTSLSIGARMDVPLFLAILAECLDRAGDRDGAFDALDEAFARVGRNRSFFYLPELYRMSADLLHARGDVEAALSARERARALAEEQQSPFFAARL